MMRIANVSVTILSVLSLLLGTRINGHSTTAITLSPSSFPGTYANIQAAINANPAGTQFNFQCGTYRFKVNNDSDLNPKSGDRFVGQNANLGYPSGAETSVPSSPPCADLSGAILVPTESPDSAWHASGALWYNTVGSRNYLTADATAFEGLCYTGPGTTTTSTSPGGCAYPQDLFFNSLMKVRLAAGDNGSTDQWPPKPGFWYLDVTGKHGAPYTVWVADKPTGQTVELSTVRHAFNSANPNVAIENLTVEKFAMDYADGGAIWGYGNGWLVNGDWIEHNHYMGISANGTTGNPPQNWTVSYNEEYQNGNGGMGGPDINGLWTYNKLDQNGEVNYANDSGDKWTGNGSVISYNKVNNTNGVGLWADVGATSLTFDHNQVTGGIGEGIRCEISHYCKFTNNTMTNDGLYDNGLCVTAHVPMPDGNDYCTGPKIGTMTDTCLNFSFAPGELTSAQSDNTTIGGSGNGNTISTKCGGIAVATGTRNSTPQTGLSATYNTLTYTGSGSNVPNFLAAAIVNSGGLPIPSGTYNYNTYNLGTAGNGLNWSWSPNGSMQSKTFSQWQSVPQDTNGTNVP